MKNLLILVHLFIGVALFGQTFSGTITDNETGNPLSGVEITLLEDNLKQTTTANGQFSFNSTTAGNKTLYFNKEGYVFEDLYNQSPSTTISIALRAKKISAATVRWNRYTDPADNCISYNNPQIPDNETWNVKFSETALTGDLVANSLITRRDPSSVIKYNNKYYVWYSRKLTQTSTYFGTNNLNDNVFPWDYSDVYYATSTDGFDWKEEGPAVERGPAGSFDDRSVFTPEVFAHNDKFYLVYQVVKSPYIERVKNNVAMAVADSPNGPWRKLAAPILRPSHNGVWTAGSKSRFDADVKGDFDSHKVHDPCLMLYKNKFYLYYKGERMGEDNFCGEREIRWGVAIADNIEGPYVKSEYNPITNTGHEVSVWNYNDGIAIIQKLDGPEIGSIQFAPDGVNFEMMGTASGTAGRNGNEVPDALGIFRPETISTTDPKFGVSWGLSHHLDFSRAANGATGGWMYLRRFDLINKNREKTITVQSGDELIIEAEKFNETDGDFDDDEVPFGVNASNIGINFVNANDSATYEIEVTEAGTYSLSYLISAPGDNAEVQLLLNGTVVADDQVPNNGSFDDYEVLLSTSVVELSVGIHRLTIVASGSDTWQWNLDKFTLKKESSLSVTDNKFDIATKVVIYPNPASDQITVQGIDEAVEYSIVDLKGAILKEGIAKTDSSISIEELPTNVYLLVLKNTNNSVKSSLFVKK